MKEIKTRETRGADAEAALRFATHSPYRGAPPGQTMGGESLLCIDASMHGSALSQLDQGEL